MDFKQFTTEWKDAMVYQLDKFDFDEDLNEHYIEYKESLDNYGKGMSVKEWYEFFFVDFDLDTHPYMLKEKAIKTKHGDDIIVKRIVDDIFELDDYTLFPSDKDLDMSFEFYHHIKNNIEK